MFINTGDIDEDSTLSVSCVFVYQEEDNKGTIDNLTRYTVLQQIQFSSAAHREQTYAEFPDGHNWHTLLAVTLQLDTERCLRATSPRKCANLGKCL